MKKCFKCGIVKDISEFYKHSKMADGHLNKCKECTKNDVNKRYKDNPEKIKEYEKIRSKRPERILYQKIYIKQKNINYGVKSGVLKDEKIENVLKIFLCIINKNIMLLKNIDKNMKKNTKLFVS